METIQLLGTALGLATLAGINLYLTVLLTGLAIRYDWIALASEYQQLEILAHPAVIIVAAVMFLVEFLADKVPWLDSAWDSVHTIIRPVGGTLLAIQVLGEAHPVYDVVVAMLACGMSLATHTLKAGTRVVVNGSPEPMSNIAVSLVEDVGVVGGLWLLWLNPLVALVVFVLGLAVAWWFAPRLFRAARARLWLAWKKLKAPAVQPERLPPDGGGELPARLPADADILMHRELGREARVEWAVHCMVGRWQGVCPYRDAWLVKSAEHDATLHLVAPRRFGRGQVKTLDLDGFKWSHEPRFLSENLSLHNAESGSKALLVFDRTRSQVVQLVVQRLDAIRGERNDGHADDRRPPAAESPALADSEA